MSRDRGFSLDRLSEATKRRNPHLDPAHRTPGRRAAKPKPDQPGGLGLSSPLAAFVDVAPRKCLVRITRYGLRRYDDDNMVGGSKELRDSIAAALGFPGDSEEDGLRWQYAQEKGPPRTVIEVWTDD